MPLLTPMASTQVSPYSPLTYTTYHHLQPMSSIMKTEFTVQPLFVMVGAHCLQQAREPEPKGSLLLFK